MKLAFLLYDEFTLLDLAGPIEVFRHWPGAESHYVALSHAPVRSDSRVTITPTATTESLLDPDVIVVPGTDRPDVFGADDPLAHWLRDTAPFARWVTSVCTGAFLLAHAGLLQGKRATTHWAYRAELARLGVEVVSDRVVCDGDVATAAGVSAGIDMALTLLGREAGDAVAQMTQLGIEYDPQPPHDCGSPEKAGDVLTRATRSFISTL